MSRLYNEPKPVWVQGIAQSAGITFPDGRNPVVNLAISFFL
jgi:hypothetical protein